MRKLFFIWLFFSFFVSNAQSAGQLIVKLRKVQNDSVKYALVEKHVFETKKNNLSNLKKNLNRILNYAKQKNDTLLIAQTLIEQSKLLLNNNSFKEAEKTLNSIVLPRKESRISKRLKTQIYFRKGIYYYLQFDNKKALKQFYKAYNLAKSNSFSIELIEINNNISVILTRQNQQEKALEHNRHNLSLGKLLNSQKIINKSRLNLALAFYKIHKLDSARYYSKQLIDALKGVSDLRSSAYYIYAKSSMETKPTDSIINYLNKAIYNNDGNYYAYDLLSKIYKKNNQIDEAIKYSLLSLKYAKTYLDNRFIQKELLALGLLYQEKAAFEKAYKYLRQSKNLNDSIRSVKGYNEITKAITKFDSQKKDSTIEKQQNVLTVTENKVRKQRNILLGILLTTLFVAIYFVIKYKQQQSRHQIILANKTNVERNTIAKELHETVGEQLTYIISSIDNLLFNKNLSNEHIISEIIRIKKFATQSITLFRDTLWVLSKSKITSDELLARSNLYFERIINSNKHITFNKHVHFNYQGNINTRTVIVVFRMIQEIVTNALTHSDTKVIDIYFERNKDYSIIKIKDYGKGFDPFLDNTNYGLRDVKRQVENLGGSLHIVINHGTEIILKIPVHAEG